MSKIYSENEIEILRQGGEILAKIMEELKKEVKPGATTQHLNKVAEDLVFSWGAKPSFEGFEGFPAALCTSINEEVVHAVPGKRKLKEGDILSLDLGIRLEEFCTDMAITIPIGKINVGPLADILSIIFETDGDFLIGIRSWFAGSVVLLFGFTMYKSYRQ